MHTHTYITHTSHTHTHTPFPLQLLSVMAAMAGIVLFAYEDGFKAASLVGVVLSVGAAIGASFYKVYIQLNLVPRPTWEGKSSLVYTVCACSFIPRNLCTFVNGR